MKNTSVAKTVFQIGADRQIGRTRDFGKMHHHLRAADGVIRQATRKSIACAAGGERLEAGQREQPRGTDVPGIRDDEGLARCVI